MSVTAAAGFEAAGIACGIKDGGVPDLALVATADRRPVTAAGVFTTNLAAAAPVQVSREHLRNGEAAAVILSSGNANAATGEQGRRDARRMCELTAQELGCAPTDVLVCSTGLIGYPLPMDAIEAGIPKLVAALGTDDAAGHAAADAILTTDTVRKEAYAALDFDGASAVAGLAKGAAMLSPAMATMLAVLTTDASVEPSELHGSLQRAVDLSFNALSVDGATSTNDTVLVLARGAGASITGRDLHAFTDVLADVCRDLAAQMAADAEGATKRARIVVRGARSGADAQVAARAVADSQLVQCSLNGEDPYWGRVLSELGASGAFLDPEAVEIAYNDVVACRNGVDAAPDPAVLREVMAGRDLEITCDLHLGMGEAAVLTTDLSHAYIDENRGTS
ncbi:MAG TPA: bifunctional glutamate N-acetyltransferase/amino-acid acetyltransferase ArgJ [Acidimicrobiia bacterium]